MSFLIDIILWISFVYALFDVILIPIVRPINKVIKATYYGSVMTIEYSDGTVDKYSGSCTVWRKIPMMKRCSTPTEARLCDIWGYIQKHGSPYPTAHESKKKVEK